MSKLCAHSTISSVCLAYTSYCVAVRGSGRLPVYVLQMLLPLSLELAPQNCLQSVSDWESNRTYIIVYSESAAATSKYIYFCLQIGRGAEEGRIISAPSNYTLPKTQYRVSEFSGISPLLL